MKGKKGGNLVSKNLKLTSFFTKTIPKRSFDAVAKSRETDAVSFSSDSENIDRSYISISSSTTDPASASNNLYDTSSGSIQYICGPTPPPIIDLSKSPYPTPISSRGQLQPQQPTPAGSSRTIDEDSPCSTRPKMNMVSAATIPRPLLSQDSNKVTAVSTSSRYETHLQSSNEFGPIIPVPSAISPLIPPRSNLEVDYPQSKDDVGDDDIFVPSSQNSEDGSSILEFKPPIDPDSQNLNVEMAARFQSTVTANVDRESSRESQQDSAYFSPDRSKSRSSRKVLD